MHFEDFAPGDAFTTPPVEVTEAAILEFAARYDPQPFHLDPARARDSIYGGLIASGWHVLSLTFGQVVRLGIFEDGGQGAPGLEEVRWARPVRPGDRLRMTVTVEGKTPSRTRPDRGYVMMRFEATNQDGEVVASYRSREIFRRRTGPGAG